MDAKMYGPVAIALSLAFNLTSPAQNYYVVVGTFSSQQDATEFTSYVNDKYAESATADKNKEVHIYVLQTSTRQEADLYREHLQQEIELRNNQKRNGSLLASDPLPQESSFPSVAEVQQTEMLASAEKNSETDVSATSIIAKGERALLKPKGKYFKFDVFAADGTTVPTFVHNVNLEKGREIASYQTGSYVDIVHGRNDVPITFACGVFGYKLVDKIIDYSDPSLTPGVYQDEQGAWVIPYVLEPLEKGDVSAMYNVNFYKDAVVMLPHAKDELNQLVDLMNLNSDYVIKIHGHCNGKKDRKIIALGHPKNYFDINGSLEFYGTARQLSALRADAIRTYLIKNGINPERIKTYAWGGSYMLLEENNINSKLNDRIEIEILRD